MCYLVLSEMFPTGRRATLMGICVFANRLACFFVLDSFLRLCDLMSGMANVMFMYTGLSFAGLVFVYYFIKETARQPLEACTPHAYRPGNAPNAKI